MAYTAASPYTVGEITKKTDVDVTHANTTYLYDGLSSGNADTLISSNKVVRNYKRRFSISHCMGSASGVNILPVTNGVVYGQYYVNVPDTFYLRLESIRCHVVGDKNRVKLSVKEDIGAAGEYLSAENGSDDSILAEGLNHTLYDNSAGGADYQALIGFRWHNADGSSQVLSAYGTIWAEFTLYA